MITTDSFSKRFSVESSQCELYNAFVNILSWRKVGHRTWLVTFLKSMCQTHVTNIIRSYLPLFCQNVPPWERVKILNPGQAKLIEFPHPALPPTPRGKILRSAYIIVCSLTFWLIFVERPETWVGRSASCFLFSATFCPTNGACFFL